MPLKSFIKCARIAAFSGIAVSLSACGFDGVELNGKIFDAVGLNTPPPRSDVKLKERQPLVVPPRMAALPAPDSGSNPTTQLAEITDHDADRVGSPEQLAAAQKAYCDKHYNENAAISDESLYEVKGPAGPCRKSILSLITGSTSSEDNE